MASATPVQGFRLSRSLAASGSTDTAAVVCSPGKSRGIGVQLSGTFTGTIVFEQSIDGGTTWISKTLYPAAGGVGVTSATATGQWKGAVGGETHFRARCSAFTSGPIVVDVSLTAGVDEKAAPASVVMVDPATGAAASTTDPVQVYVGNSYVRLLDTAAAIKAGAGTLAGFVVGAAGTSITVTVYDSLTAAGTVIFGPYVLVAGASLPINVAFGVGLSVGFSATTGTPNITVGYR